MVAPNDRADRLCAPGSAVGDERPGGPGSTPRLSSTSRASTGPCRCSCRPRACCDTMPSRRCGPASSASRQRYAGIVIGRQLEELKAEPMRGAPQSAGADAGRAGDAVLAGRAGGGRRGSTAGDRQHDAGAGHYWQRRAERAQRTVLRAAKTLAPVRKPGVPAVQINVDEHQVNLVGGKRAVAEHAAEGDDRARAAWRARTGRSAGS